MIVIKHKQYGEATFDGGRWMSSVKWWEKILNDTIPLDDERFTLADSFRDGGWDGICLREVQATFDVEVLRYEPEKIPELKGVIY